MRIGVPTEIKPHEYRVAITPSGVYELTTRGHEVVVQSGAGEASSITDDDYIAAGAAVVPTAAEVWGRAELLLKVKEPLPQEYPLLREDLVLFAYLHLAADRALTDALLASQVTAFAYETVQTDAGTLPLLHPMSEVAGCLAPQIGAHALMTAQGGRGVLMGGVAGVPRAKVVILGAGVSGRNAAAVAVGMLADVTVIDTDLDKLRALQARHNHRVSALASSRLTIEEQVTAADLVIGAVLIPGARTPRLVSNDMVAAMKPGSVLVDIAVDQGGCFEDSRPTTHDDPLYQVHGSTFYCVGNMPGAVPHTSTSALANATLPFVVSLAERGWRNAALENAVLGRGLTMHAGLLTNTAVGRAHGLPVTPAGEVVA